MTPPATPIPTLPGPELARALGDRLRSAGLSEQSLLAALGVHALHEIPRIPPRERAMRLATPTPFNLLLRLFYFGAELSRADALAALGPAPIDDLIAQGALAPSPAGVRAAVQLILTGPVYTTNDPPTSPSAGLLAHKVMSVAGTTRIMADVAIRRPIDSALDMGCGSGLLAIMAAAHARHVVASDFNPAAAAFARFNAALNGLSNIEAVHGDLFSAVKGRTFDAIISNPPFVMSPETTVTFRDSGMRGDVFCRRLAREAFEHLNPGGIFQMICDWPQSAPGSHDSPSPWFQGLDAEVLVLRLRTIDPASYARQWGLGGIPIDPKAGPEVARRTIEQHLTTWTDFYRAQGMAAISTGVVTLRRRAPGDAGSPWFHMEPAEEPLISAAGEQIVRLMRNQSLLHRGDQALLDAELAATPEHSISAGLAQCRTGFALATPLSDAARSVLEAARGARKGAALVAALGGTPEPALEAIKHLLRRGVLSAV